MEGASHLRSALGRWPGFGRQAGSRRASGRGLVLAALVVLLAAELAWAARPAATIAYQPMTSEGLAAGRPFEAWVVFDKSSNPAEPGYALPADATFRFTFPPAFTPQPSVHPEAVLLYGWPQKAASVPFTVGLDPQDPRTIVLTLTESFPVGPPERPGLKAIHLRMGPGNPAQAGAYPITIRATDAGPLSGTIQAIAHITERPVPLVAAYNQLHQGRNEDWQRVRAGAATPLPIDFLVTLPGEARSSISLRSGANGNLDILSDDHPIGTITARGVPITLTPEAFGPGFARLGIVRFDVQAGMRSGEATIQAALQGGAACTIHVLVTP
jgi:hypothetical protein